MDRNRAGILYGICFILLALVMGGLHLLLTGFGPQFGAGVTVGLFIGIGLTALASRQVRES